MYCIFSHSHFSAGPLYDKHPSYGQTQIVEHCGRSENNSAGLAKGGIVTTTSIAGLPARIGLDPALENTVAQWNAAHASGHDPQFGSTPMVAPIANGPF